MRPKHRLFHFVGHYEFAGSHRKKSPFPGTAFWAVLALAAALRLYALGAVIHYGTTRARVPYLARFVNLHGSLFRSEFTTEPPMMALLSWLWQGALTLLPLARISWQHDAAIRLLPALFGLASVACVFFGVRALLDDRRAALLAMTAVAVAPLQVYYAQEFRRLHLLCSVGAGGHGLHDPRRGVERKPLLGGPGREPGGADVQPLHHHVPHLHLEHRLRTGLAVAPPALAPLVSLESVAHGTHCTRALPRFSHAGSREHPDYFLVSEPHVEDSDDRRENLLRRVHAARVGLLAAVPARPRGYGLGPFHPAASASPGHRGFHLGRRARGAWRPRLGPRPVLLL